MIAALSRLGGSRASAVPMRLTDLDSAARHVVVEFAALTGAPHESLEALDAKAFQLEQSTTQLFTTGLVLFNGLMIGVIVIPSPGGAPA